MAQKKSREHPPVLLGPGQRSKASTKPGQRFRNIMSSGCTGCRWAMRGSGAACRNTGHCQFAARSYQAGKDPEMKDYRTRKHHHGIIKI